MALGENVDQQFHSVLLALEDAFNGQRVEPNQGRIKHGWTIVNSEGAHLCTLYYERLKKNHYLELAVSPSQALGSTSGEKFAQQVEQEIGASGRRGKRHSPFPYPIGNWPTLGFIDEAQALEFFERVRLQRLLTQPPNAFEQAVTSLPENTVVERLSNQRRGQAMLRRLLLRERGGRCELTGLAVRRLLRCSHIKAWADASPTERFDLANCLLLAPHVDALFDAGYLTFDDEGRAMFSNQLQPADISALGLSVEKKLWREPTPEQREFFVWHRVHIFRS